MLSFLFNSVFSCIGCARRFWIRIFGTLQRFSGDNIAYDTFFMLQLLRGLTQLRYPLTRQVNIQNKLRMHKDKHKINCM